MAEDASALRRTLVECLTECLSPDHRVRCAAEERLKLLEVKEEYGVHLAQLVTDIQGSLPIRQLASVVLKQYVQVHWSSLSEKFAPPETSDQGKVMIRELLPHGLQDPAHKIRASVAYVISAIAHWDWPDYWPDLFEKLMHALASDDRNLVHGAMRVLTEFAREITDTQVPHVAAIVLPQMCMMITEHQKYGIRLRSRAVDIFNTFAELIGAVKAVCKQLFPILENFISVLTQLLAVPDGDTSDCGLKMEVLKALATMIAHFRKQMIPHLPNILPHVWTTLTQGAERYYRTVVDCIEDVDDPVDSDGEILGFDNVIFSIFEFIHALIDSSKFKSVVATHLEHLLYFLLVYMQITEDQVCAWSMDPNRYVEDEDDDTFSFSVRISAQNLLLSLAAEMRDESAVCLVQALSKHLQESRLSRTSGKQSWWKIEEACMLAIGSIQPLISEKVARGQLQFDIPGFLTEVVLPALDASSSPFLIGRALWFSSRFTTEMSPDLLARFLQVTVGGLQGNQVPAIRIGAARAIYGYCDHLKSNGNSALIQPYLPDVFNNLTNMAMQYNEDALSLVLETLSVVISIDKDTTALWEEKITPLVIALFLKHGQDPALSPIIENIFRELASNEACNTLLQQRFLPTVVSLLESPQEKIPLGIRPVALDILCHIVRSSPRELSETLINNVFPPLVSFILRSDDSAILQSGSECVRAYVSKGCDQLLNWHDSSSNNGIAYVVQVISHLLHPQICEFASAFVGKLVIILAKKVGQTLGDKLDLMLRETLSKLQQAETLTVIQSLMMVFISLMYHRLADTLAFLCNVPDPTGKPALEFVVNIWCSRQQEFFGTYDSKVRILSMCKLLEHTVNNGDRRLSEIMVKGERQFENETGIRTRSKAAKQPEQWTIIPAPLKFYKLIIGELSNFMQNAEGGQEESDDDENDWEDDDEDVSEEISMKQFLDSVIAPASEYPGFDNLYDDFVFDEVEDDPDVLDDPIYTMDIQSYLVEFLRAFSTHPSFSAFNNELTVNESQTLRKAGIIQ